MVALAGAGRGGLTTDRNEVLDAKRVAARRD